MAKAIRLNGLKQEGVLMYADVTTPDGGRCQYIFPTDTLEWRAAEYGLDPLDLDTLLEIVLAEPYLDPDPEDPNLALFDAESVGEARDHHLKKVRKVVVDKDADAWERAKKGAVMSYQAIKLKAEHVQRGREARKEEKAKRPATEADRIAALRAVLDTNKGGS